jgi:hypothetical protein
MASPFPGMDPYLEHPNLWAGVHLLLIAAIAEALTPSLRPKYSISVEVRMYQGGGDQAILVGVPDAAIQRVVSETGAQVQSVAIADPPMEPIKVRLSMPALERQGYLEIREVATKTVVTAIEILSPTNKRAGRGRQEYEEKRSQILASSTHLIEIDLLRAGQPMALLSDRPASDYRILVSRAEQRPLADWYALNLPNPLPMIPVPLQLGDSEPLLNLKQVLDTVYDRAAYDLKLDYRADPEPPLAAATTLWADQLLIAANLRQG